MSTATVGRRVEHQVRDDLSQAGWVVAARAAASKGPCDLIAFRPGQAALVQVKRTNALLPPAERHRLIALADVLGLAIALPIVATKPTRQPITYRLLTGFGPKDWTAWNPRGEPVRELNPYNTSLTITGLEAPPEHQRAAAVTCAAYARSAPELVELLDMLGILEDAS